MSMYVHLFSSSLSFFQFPHCRSRRHHRRRSYSFNPNVNSMFKFTVKFKLKLNFRELTSFRFISFHPSGSSRYDILSIRILRYVCMNVCASTLLLFFLLLFLLVVVVVVVVVLIPSPPRRISFISFHLIHPLSPTFR